mmetsp:Transcript_103246/g.245901  ORF Transcript_103246/g.245901 Transcript_103246/m.245901 type:complete len:209 (+) Transcript_103246:2293-2919(+)
MTRSWSWYCLRARVIFSSRSLCRRISCSWRRSRAATARSSACLSCNCRSSSCTARRACARLCRASCRFCTSSGLGFEALPSRVCTFSKVDWTMEYSWLLRSLAFGSVCAPTLWSSLPSCLSSKEALCIMSLKVLSSYSSSQAPRRLLSLEFGRFEDLSLLLNLLALIGEPCCTFSNCSAMDSPPLQGRVVHATPDLKGYSPWSRWYSC